MWHILALFALYASAQGRAVNISNTWVLPEEGFPVFYRYFRDRISWYEADAVCQFHHANLVTVDTTAQYDAVRAYLKELDISSAVWVGLIRSNPDGDFTWTDYRGLSSDGYWSSAPDARAAPLCAAADPAADYRWEARSCGGPTVASFICELPVPQWALGNEGCMVRALPALTVLYLPESAAVQLTADCGLAGVKRVQCTGNVKRELLLKELSCAEDEEPSSTLNIASTSVTYSAATTDTVFTEQVTISDLTIDENVTTEHEDDINQTNYIKSTPAPNTFKSLSQDNLVRLRINTQNKGILNKDINLNVVHNNNLQSNEIPKIANIENYLTKEHLDKLEDEKNMQHKMLHDELARLGNFETIFTQPTDHFVPPLVMARSKLSDDMTVLSLEEKHAQQIAEQEKHRLHRDDNLSPYFTQNNNIKTTVDDSSSSVLTTGKPILMTLQPKDIIKKVKPKSNVPKKYIEKQFDLKNKVLKTDTKTNKIEKLTSSYVTQTESTITEARTSTEANVISTSYVEFEQNKSEEEPSIDLTVIIKNSDSNNKNENTFKGDVPKIEVIENDTTITDPEFKLIKSENITRDAQQEISVKIPAQMQNLTLNHEVIKITIINEENSSATPIIFEVTTIMPVVHSDSKADQSATIHDITDSTTKGSTESIMFFSPHNNNILTTTELNRNDTDNTHEFTTTSTQTSTKLNYNNKTQEELTATKSANVATTLNTNVTVAIENSSDDKSITTVSNSTTKLVNDFTIDNDDMDKNSTEASETIDDLNSPLLSGANEPIHRPNRSRRPQQPPSRLNKFNPFRMLG